MWNISIVKDVSASASHLHNRTLIKFIGALMEGGSSASVWDHWRVQIKGVDLNIKKGSYWFILTNTRSNMRAHIVIWIIIQSLRFHTASFDRRAYAFLKFISQLWHAYLTFTHICFPHMHTPTPTRTHTPSWMARYNVLCRKYSCYRNVQHLSL